MKKVNPNNSDLIYIVSGIMRSGSSLLMEALQAGGMDIVSHPARDTMNKIQTVDGKPYIVNPHGFFEVLPSFSTRPDFPKGHEGKVIKCLIPRILSIPRGNYKIILMKRNVREIIASWKAAFEGIHPGSVGLNMHRYDVLIEKVVLALQDLGAEVIVINYEDVLKAPFAAFEGLKKRGWPIDVEKAAAKVDPSLHRIRVEDMGERKAVYVVSGLQRTGTSMMMQALEAGGMTASYDPKRNVVGWRGEPLEYEGKPYDANPRGYYEFSDENRVWEPFEWAEELGGTVAKNLIPGIMTLAIPPEVDYKIIMMFRNVEEIKKSWMAARIDPINFDMSNLNIAYYDQFMQEAIEFLEKERYAQVISVHYDRVIKRPKMELRKIKNAGWPIDVNKAVAAIDPKLYRIKVKK